MEFRIAKTEFLRGLRLAQGIADRKSMMPMLANVLLRTQGKNQPISLPATAYLGASVWGAPTLLPQANIAQQVAAHPRPVKLV